MGKTECICGEILSDSYGCDGYAFTEEQLELEIKTEYGEYREILECPKCGTLSIEDGINSCYVKYYKPESGKFNKLFRNQ